MYEVRVEVQFSAAHQIRLYDGKLEPIHRHDWRVEAVFRGPVLDRIGVLVDFEVAKNTLHEIVDRFAGTNINHLPLLKGRNPTAENIAGCIFNELKQRLDGNLPLAAVHVREAPGCAAGYMESIG